MTEETKDQLYWNVVKYGPLMDHTARFISTKFDIPYYKVVQAFEPNPKTIQAYTNHIGMEIRHSIMCTPGDLCYGMASDEYHHSYIVIHKELHEYLKKTNPLFHTDSVYYTYKELIDDAEECHTKPFDILHAISISRTYTGKEDDYQCSIRLSDLCDKTLSSLPEQYTKYVEEIEEYLYN